jgi:hypothetical protein
VEIVFWIPILVVLTIVVVAAFAVGMAATSRGSRTVMWCLLGALFVILVVGGAVLVIKPNRAVLAVVGPAGSAFAGKVVVDGVEERIEGVVPAEFEFVGRRIEYAVIPVTAAAGAPMGVKHRYGEVTSPHGAQGTLIAMPGGFTHAAHAVTESDWWQLSTELGITAEEEVSTDAASGDESDPARPSTQEP